MIRFGVMALVGSAMSLSSANAQTASNEVGKTANDYFAAANAAGGDFRLKPDAPLFSSVGFKPIPVEAIGLYQDEYRATWPVATTPVIDKD